MTEARQKGVRKESELIKAKGVMRLVLRRNQQSAIRSERDMEGIEGNSSRYSLKPSRICNEDVLICVDVDPQCLVEMKGATGPNGRPLTRLDSIKQAIVLFVNAKLTINPEHRFAFATLSNTLVSWVSFFLFCSPSINFGLGLFFLIS